MGLTFLFLGFLGAGTGITKCTTFAEALRFAFADALQFCADPTAGAGVAGLLDKARSQFILCNVGKAIITIPLITINGWYKPSKMG